MQKSASFHIAISTANTYIITRVIKPPKAVRRHAMCVDSEILDVTKNRFLD